LIHHVQLACPEGGEPALRDFYGGVLGLEEIQKPPSLAARGGCWFRGHDIEIHLGVEEDFRPARKAHPGLLVAGLDAWAGRLRDAGYPVRFDAEFPGMRRFYSEDPNGNRLEFLEPLAAGPIGTSQVTFGGATGPQLSHGPSSCLPHISREDSRADLLG